jgi:hypothetical protein
VSKVANSPKSKEKILTVAKRMKKLCKTSNNSAEAMAFLNDAVTLMDLVLKEGGEE